MKLDVCDAGEATVEDRSAPRRHIQSVVRRFTSPLSMHEQSQWLASHGFRIARAEKRGRAAEFDREIHHDPPGVPQ